MRIGSPALTTRGLKEAHFEIVGDFLMEALDIAKETQAKGGKKLTEFRDALGGNPRVAALKGKVEAFAKPFPMPGIPVSPPQ